MNTILLVDDYDYRVYAVLRSKESADTIKKVFQEVKDRMPGEWQYDDLIDGLNEKNIEFEVCENVEEVQF